VIHLSLYVHSVRDDRDLLAAILRIAPTSLLCAALIFGAGFADEGIRPVFWLAALAVGYFGPLVGGTSGWRVQPAHFVERHGLIVIIAIGESLVAIGIGASGTGLGAGVIVAAVIGLVVATSFWLAYFDFFTIRAEQLLADRDGAQRAALARDAYTYLHLPMVTGIVLFAFALKVTLAHVGRELDTIPALALCGGPALYLFAYVGLRLRISRRVGRGRFAAAIACAALTPIAVAVAALVALCLVAAVWIALHLYELVWWREERSRTRARRVPASVA
jgi:low temperature requirement protein LtrA